MALSPWIARVTALLLLASYQSTALAVASDANLKPASLDEADWKSLQRAVGQQTRLVAADGAAQDRFGSSVSISGDSALIGATRIPEGPMAAPGVAYVYTRVGTVWTQQARLEPPGSAPGDSFGWATEITGDTAVVTAPSSGGGVGAAYVYLRSGGLWTLQAKLQPEAGVLGGNFGASVAISGGTILVGAPRQNSDQGAVYVYARSGPSWAQQAKLIAVDGAADDAFGVAVALSENTALIGAEFDTTGAVQGQGSAYVYNRNGAIWTLQAKLIAQDGAEFDVFGSSVALAGDTALVGAIGADFSGGNAQGAAYVFTRNAGVWTQQAKLRANDEGDWHGFSRALTLRGDTALIGASGATVGSNLQQGVAYLFVRTGTTWNQRIKLQAEDGEAESQFGGAVALSGDTAVIGARLQRVGGKSAQGAAYVYTGIIGLAAPVPVPTLSTRALWLLVIALSLAGLIALRRI